MAIASPSILISDDDVEFRETLRGMFEPRGYRTIVAGDGEEAVEIVRSEPIHLVLLDLHMPKLSGLEVLQLIKQFNARIMLFYLQKNFTAVQVNDKQVGVGFQLQM